MLLRCSLLTTMFLELCLAWEALHTPTRGLTLYQSYIVVIL
jgi:hypothetical protein